VGQRKVLLIRNKSQRRLNVLLSSDAEGDVRTPPLTHPAI